ncbi:MAG TPA: porin [Casimicrobiaceae bacterium]|nr:porin [Casimicrobiaceae bacterium]
MKKKLVAVAVAGLIAAPLAAEAQTANVTLYGRLNGDLEFVSGRQADGSNPWVSRFSSNSSRFGVRGTESLGGGLNAIFQIESNVSFDTGNSSTSGFASRETFVGLQGPWGTFKAGKFLMPYDDLHPIFGNVPTYTTSILSTADLWAQGTLSKFAGGFDARLGNSMRYDSPTWSGFNFSAQIALRDSSGFADNTGPSANTANPILGGDNGDHAAELRHAYVAGVAGYYNNGPLQLGAGWEGNYKVRNYAITGGQFYADDYAYTLTGAYNFGVVRPALVYERLKYDTPTGDIRRDFWGVSATAPLGPGVLYAFYGQAQDGKGSAADGTRVGGLTKGNDTGSKQYEISYTYPFSKRTSVYAGYVKLDNDRNAAYTFNINSYSFNTGCTVSQPTCGENGKPEGIVFGIIHLF